MKSQFSIAVLLAALFAVGCSSNKKSQSWIGKVYHNTTARYNGYYYARLKMTEAENTVLASRKDDYEKILPLYLTGNPEDQFSSADMDSIIKRLTVVVKLHEKSKWTDDSYFNIGKAYFYKKDYESAQATFQYVSSQFKDQSGSSSSSSSSKKKKKGKKKSDKNVNEYTGTVKEISQSSGFKMLKHKPVHYADVLWLVRAHAMNKNYGEAHAILSYLDNDTKFPAELKGELQLMHAFVFIQQKQYRNAAEPMMAAIKLTKNKKLETRYTYILAQLYQFSGDYGKAGQTFTQVPELQPSYEMDFNARIAVVKNYVASGSGSPSQIIAELEEMAKNDNFSEFNDAIYYYIGLVHLKQGKEEEAIRDFETSIEASRENTNQKGLSFLKIGELSMAYHDYMTAAPYYDSAVVYLSEKFDTLNRVKELQVILNNMEQQIAIINSQDSLQRLADMDEKERDKLIDQMVTKAEREKNEEEQASNVTNVFSQNTSSQSTQSSGGTWYFYNPSLRSSGFNDYMKKWGDRENADNWRRSNKRSGGETTQVDESENETSDGKGAASGEDAFRNSLLENIPLTPEKMEASNRKIFDAYYALGTIYNSDLYNTAKAIETFEKSAARFESDPSVVKAYYNLYLLYRNTGNSAKAESYRQRILNDYATSEFAAVLLDPEYFTKQEEKKNAANVFYASAYNDFLSSNFDTVFTHVKTADSLFKPNPIEAKFDLLKALAIGSTQDRNAYIAALDSLVNKYPSGEEHDKAVEILTLLGAPPKTAAKDLEEVKKQEKKVKGPSPYQFKAQNPHYLVVAFKTVDPKTKAISDSLANFNTKSYSLANLKVSTQLLDKSSQLILVKQFKGMEDAVDYYDQVTTSETLFEQVEAIGYRVFLIDDKNFILFYQRKNIDEYVEFFERYYENMEEEAEEDEGE